MNTTVNLFLHIVYVHQIEFCVREKDGDRETMSETGQECYWTEEKAED